MTKKSVEILGLPVISITEGRELGISKTLVIDAKAGVVAAITIEDEDWYRGVKLLPYSSVIAIGHDAVTVTSSNSILTLEESSDFEAMLDSNIRIIGTKAITKTGTINGKVSEIYINDEDGMVEKIQILTPDGSESEIVADEISIFGKQVTVIGEPGDGANREKPIFSPAKAVSESESNPEPMTKETPIFNAIPEPTPEPEAEIAPEPESEIAPKPEPEIMPDPKPEIVPEPEPKIAPESEPMPALELELELETTEPEAAPPPSVTKPKKTATAKTKTSAKSSAKSSSKTTAKTKSTSAKKQSESDEKTTMDRHRRFLKGKKATRDILAANGLVIAKAGDEITEPILHNAQIAGKLIELSMNVQ